MTQAALRDPTLAQRLADEILHLADRPVRLMEFCGGHTHAILRFGIRERLAPNVRLLSGPGCPVCVTATPDIDASIALARLPGVTVATFGDMLRVPGSRGTLMQARAEGADVRIVYSALDALDLARREPQRHVIMLGIGFETTAPTVAATITQAHAEGLRNYSVLSLHKLTGPAMRAILEAGEVRLDGVIGPGHVTTIIGWQAWEFLPQEYGISCAVSGFEPLDILRAVRSLVQAIREGRPRVTNDYPRSVSREGNHVAQALMAEVFTVGPALWRGLGNVPASGLFLKATYADYDTRQRFGEALAALPPSAPDPAGCRCGEVLRGVLEPPECPLFRRVCTPAHPVGPCMVSAEGACAAYYRYGSL